MTEGGLLTRLGMKWTELGELKRQDCITISVADPVAPAIEGTDIILRGANANKMGCRRRTSLHL